MAEDKATPPAEGGPGGTPSQNQAGQPLGGDPAAEFEAAMIAEGLDPEKLPQELQEAKKSMQRAFTKKCEGRAEERKLAESLKQKAEAFDALVAEPEFYELAYGTKAPPGTEPADKPETKEPEFDLENATETEKQLYQRVQDLRTRLEEVDAQTRRTIDKQMDQEWKELHDWTVEMGYPNSDDYLPQMARLVHRGAAETARAAYLQIVGEKLVEVGEQRALKSLEQKKLANVEAKGGPSDSLAFKEAVDFDQAFEIAKAKIEKEGK